MLDAAADHDAQVFGDFLKARAQLMRTLEVALSGEVIDAEQVQRLGAAVGELEASMTWAQATAMLQVRTNLSEGQLSDLLALREECTAGQDSLPQDPVDRGRQLFAQCALCHDSTDRQAVASELTGIVDRQIANDETFDGYSHALRTYAETNRTWSEALLDSFLESPRSLVPGTYMGFDGLDERQDRSAVIAYLKIREQERNVEAGER